MGSIRPAMTPERINQINQLIFENPEWHRTKLSQELCRIWDWRGENGQLKDISCRDVLTHLSLLCPTNPVKSTFQNPLGHYFRLF